MPRHNGPRCARRAVAEAARRDAMAVLFATVAFAMPVAPKIAAAESCAPPARPRLAEILYDAAGDDTGFEFVELHHPGSAPFALSGARLQTGDGSGPGRWTTRWTAAPGDTIAAGGRFVIGGARVQPPPDVLAALDLQNGPDAVRVVWPDGLVEVVGYGALEFPEYACGAPAADVAGGLSLARVPDDADGGSNAVDFRAAAPSPGVANLPGRDLAVVAGATRAEPEQPDAFAAWTLHVAIENRGATAVEPGSAAIHAGIDGAPARVETMGVRLAPGDRVSVAIAMPGLPAGRVSARVQVGLPGDERGNNDLDSLQLRVGPGALTVTEIQFHPTDEAGEWFEVLNRGDEAQDLATLLLADRTGNPSPVTAGSGRLPPGSRALFTQSRAAWLAAYPRADSTRVWSASSWPALNNNDDSLGIADEIVLRDGDGVLIERARYSAARVPAGFPIERGPSGLWEPGPEPAGTPLDPPRVVPEAAGGFEVELTPATPRARRLRWTLPWARARVQIDAWDLAGRRQGAVMAEALVPGRGERAWEGGGLPPGIYVFALTARPEQGADRLTLVRAVRLPGAR